MANGVVCAALFLADYPCYSCKTPPEQETLECFCDCHELHSKHAEKFVNKPKPPADVKIVGTLAVGQ